MRKLTWPFLMTYKILLSNVSPNSPNSNKTDQKEYTNYCLRTYIEAENINANYTQPLTHNVENTKGNSRVMFTF